MNCIVLTWPTYLADPEYWQQISKEKSITLHINNDKEVVK